MQSRPDRRSRRENILDEDLILNLDGKRNIRLVQLMQTLADIVPVKSNIQFSVVYLPSGHLCLQLPHYPVGKIDTPGLNTDQHGIFQVDMILQHLVTQPLYRNSQLLLIQDRLQVSIFMAVKKSLIPQK